MKCYFTCLLLFALMMPHVASTASGQEVKPRLLIAFGSYRERARYPTIFFYQHDGVASGKIAGSIPGIGKRSDSHPSLSFDGRYCAIASEEENQASKVMLWDRTTKKFHESTTLNKTPNAQLHPTLSGDGKLMAFAAWNRPDSTQRWDLFLYDVGGKQAIFHDAISTQRYDERMPALSGDGKTLVYTSNTKGGVGLTDIYLFRQSENALLDNKNLNSTNRDAEPSLSSDGSLLAFSSDRGGGAGGRDIYLYDVDAKKLLPLPGLNSVAHEQTPSLSGDGRYIAFVSERIAGAGERDIYLYDRKLQKLLPTPELNHISEDIDPCVIVLPKKE